MSPNEGPAEIGQAGDEASCAGVLEPAGEEEPDAEAAVSQQDMSVADMLLPEENADSNAVPMESDMPEEEPPTEEILAGTLLESGEDTFRTQKMEAESADDEPMQDWGMPSLQMGWNILNQRNPKSSWETRAAVRCRKSRQWTPEPPARKPVRNFSGLISKRLTGISLRFKKGMDGHLFILPCGHTDCRDGVWQGRN